MATGTYGGQEAANGAKAHAAVVGQDVGQSGAGVLRGSVGVPAHGSTHLHAGDRNKSYPHGVRAAVQTYDLGPLARHSVHLDLNDLDPGIGQPDAVGGNVTALAAALGQRTLRERVERFRPDYPVGFDLTQQMAAGTGGGQCQRVFHVSPIWRRIRIGDVR